MKQVSFPFWAALTVGVGMALSACSSDGDVMVEKPVFEMLEEGSPIIFTATINGEKNTRAVGSSWTNGDAIGITMTTGEITEDTDVDESYIEYTGRRIERINWKYVYSSSVDAWTCEETLALKRYSADTFNFYMYYPYVAGPTAGNLPRTGNDGGTPCSIEIDTKAANQAVVGEPTADTYTQKNIDFLWGTTNTITSEVVDGETVYKVGTELKHKMALMTVVLKAGDGLGSVKGITFDIDNMLMTGLFNPLSGLITPSETREAMGAVSASQLAVADGPIGAVAGDWKVGLLFIPQTITTGTTLTVNVTMDDGDSDDTNDVVRTFTKSITGNWLAMEAGNNYIVTLTIDSGYKLRITGMYINAWDSGSATNGTLEEPIPLLYNNNGISQWGNSGSGGVIVE
ncbi:MAG: fimbrillin family protein [Prevotella sp.]|nr:fimbrillin family protein [Prevotella sp.]